VLLAGLVRLVLPMVVSVSDVVEQLLRVRVKQRRGGQRRVGTRRGVRVAGGVDLVDLALALVGKQALADAAIESFKLLRAWRRNGPRFGGREGLRREQRGGRRQDVQA
jgi:hypothetical protein